MTPVNVTVKWPKDVGDMPQGSILRVLLEEVSIADRASTTLAETLIEAPDASSPVTLEVHVPHGASVAALNVRAHVSVHGVREVRPGDLLTTQSYPVSSDGDEAEVVVQLQRI